MLQGQKKVFSKDNPPDFEKLELEKARIKKIKKVNRTTEAQKRYLRINTMINYYRNRDRILKYQKAYRQL